MRSTNRRSYGKREKITRRRMSPEKKKIISVSVLIAALVLVVSLCFCLFAPVFNIESIICEGNSKVHSDTIIEASGIQTGKNIFLTRISDKKRNVKSVDYIENCHIERVLPNTVKINVTECKPYAYFSVGDTLSVSDASGVVLEIVSDSDDVGQIVESKISEEEQNPADEDTESGEAEEEEDLSTADGTIWGYDDDGDPIYRVNGGHYEFDEDGNRYFVDDTPSTPEPTEGAENAEADVYSGDDLNRTTKGTIIHSAPIVYGVDITKNHLGSKLESSDKEKLASVLEALGYLDKTGLLERTTKFDAENMNDVKFFIEDRLEVWFGSLDDFEYKAKLVASVIDNNLSKYESAIMDFRDSKLYVRSADYKTPETIEFTPEPSSTDFPDDADSREDNENDDNDDNDENDDNNDNDDKEIKSTSKPSSTTKPSSTSKPTSTSRPQDNESEDEDEEENEQAITAKARTNPVIFAR